MPIEDLSVKENHPSGAVLNPGASIVLSVHGPTGRDSAPDTGYDWKAKLNGVPITQEEIFEGSVPHTTDRRDFNGKLKESVRGSLEITLKGHDAATRQLNKRWSYTIAEVAAVPAPNPADPTPVDESLGPWPKLFDTRLEKLQSDVDEIKSVLLEK